MKKLTQKKINIINLLIAIIALILSLPSAINQIQQFKDQFRVKKTKIIYYSPPDISIKNAKKGFCNDSLVSNRMDAAGCILENVIL